MNAISDSLSVDSILIWTINLLLQVTLVAGCGLVAASLLRRSSAFRYGVLLASLGCLCLAPFSAMWLAGSGYGRVSLAIRESTSEAAGNTIAATGSRGESGEDMNAAALPQHDSESVLLSASEEDTAAESLAPFVQLSQEMTAELEGDAQSAGHDTDGWQSATMNRNDAVSENRFGPGETSSHLWFATLRVVGGVFGVLWLAGFILVAARNVVGARRLTLMLRHAQANDDPRLLRIAAQACSLLKYEGRVAIETVSGIGSPIAVGVRRPRVVLPKGFEDLVSDDQLRDVLIHEFAHLMRRDQCLVLIQIIVGNLFWFHPLVRQLNRQLSHAREEICDNYVLASSNAPAYSRTLLKLAKVVRLRAELTGTVGFLTANWKLETRVRGLLDSRRKPMTTNPFAVKCAVFMFAISMLALPGFISIRSVDANETLPVVNRNAGASKPASPSPQSAESARPSPHLGPQEDNATEPVVVSGVVQDSEGTPLASASLVVLGMATQLNSAGDFSSRVRVLSETQSDENGRFKIRLEGVTSSRFLEVTVVAGREGQGLTWEKINCENKRHELSLSLQPERPIRCRFIDLEGQPIPDLEVRVESVMVNDGSEFPSNSVRLERLAVAPAPWPVAVRSDEKGRFTIRGVNAGCGVYLKAEGSEFIAPQGISVNTGMPEQRGPYDGTYRPLVKNVADGEEAILTLAPATRFIGSVRFADSGDSVPNARLSIFSSQQDRGGSMIGLQGEANELGHYSLNPYPGVRFDILAYPPKETPYLTRRIRGLRDADGDEPNQVDIELPRGVLVRGVVKNSVTGAPIPNASVQYIPERLNNPNVQRDVVTGWQAIELTDDKGEFTIPVYAGPGTLAVSGGMGMYVLKQVGSRQLSQGATGGQRNYAHAFESIDPKLEDGEVQVAIQLDPGQTVSGALTDNEGNPIESAMTVSALRIHPLNLTWRSVGGLPNVAGNGRFQLDGLPVGEDSEVFFLDPERRLGATVMLNTDNDSHDVQLKPCGQAHLRIVDQNGDAKAGMRPTVLMVVKPGSPMRDQLPSEGEYIADTDFIQNIDRVNHRDGLATDENGEVTIKALIPGATYRLMGRAAGKYGVVKEWIAKSGETTELGEVTFPDR